MKQKKNWKKLNVVERGTYTKRGVCWLRDDVIYFALSIIWTFHCARVYITMGPRFGASKSPSNLPPPPPRERAQFNLFFIYYYSPHTWQFIYPAIFFFQFFCFFLCLWQLFASVAAAEANLYASSSDLDWEVRKAKRWFYKKKTMHRTEKKKIPRMCSCFFLSPSILF